MRKMILAGTALLAACGSQAPANGGEAAAGDRAGTERTVQPASRSFRDWMVGCDNGDDCVAIAGPVDGSAGWLRVALGAGPDARPAIMAGLWSDGPENAAAPLTIQIDGRGFVLTPHGELGEAGVGVLAADQARAALDALAAARSLKLVKGSDSVDLSPNGASAALLWIDERQGRLDTPTALIRRGERAADGVPAAPVLPRIRPAAAVDQTGMPGPDGAAPALPAALAGLAEVKQCAANLSWNPGLSGAVTRYRLDARSELWGVPCDAGAYNVTMLYWITGPNGANPRAAAFRGLDGEAQAELTNAAYDPVARTLSQFAKGRGIGDCGVFQTWTWTAHGFVLSHEAAMGECWGVPSELWPTRWRSRTD